jgi:hypothetical protein
MESRCLISVVISCLLMACATPDRERDAAQTVEVYKPDGSRQCETDSGIPLSVMKQELSNAAIQVLSSRSAHDCLFRPALCGTATGVINIYEIAANRLSDVQDLGFIPYDQLRARCGAH